MRRKALMKWTVRGVALVTVFSAGYGLQRAQAQDTDAVTTVTSTKAELPPIFRDGIAIYSLNVKVHTGPKSAGGDAETYFLVKRRIGAWVKVQRVDAQSGKDVGPWFWMRPGDVKQESDSIIGWTAAQD